MWSIFFETFCIFLPNSLRQDLIVEISTKNEIKFVKASWARNGQFEHFFGENGPSSFKD